jgi:hypothetical protein
MRRTVIRLAAAHVARLDAGLAGKKDDNGQPLSRAGSVRRILEGSAPPLGPVNPPAELRRTVIRLAPAHLARLDAALAGQTDDDGQPLCRSALVRRILEARARPLGVVEPLTPASPASRGSLTRLILETLTASPDEVFGASSLSRAIGWKNADSVRNRLCKLAGQRALERVGPGRYRGLRPAEGAARSAGAAARPAEGAAA